MATFTDKKKREWVLDLDLVLVERVEKATGVKLRDLLAHKAAGLGALFANDEQFVRVL